MSKSKKVKFINGKNCATATSTALGSCTSYSVSATNCCDCFLIAANQGASLAANYKLQQQMWILAVLEEFC